MTSLTEVYEGGSGGTNLRRLYLGVLLFLTGVALVIGGIVFATADPRAGLFGMEWWQQREAAGVLAGVGLPAMFLGVSAVLPASRRLRTWSVVGAAVTLCGAGLFYAVYPENWIQGEPSYALHVVAVYFLGTTITVACLFLGVVNFKTRNDPGGTVKLEVTREGETRIVEVDRSRLGGLGGVGFLGDPPDGSVETQTARATPRSDGGSESASTASSATGTASSETPSRPADPGSASTPTPDEGAELVAEASPRNAPDTYCGNCTHFRYVRTDDGLRPYCGYHAEVMDDMDPCPQWERNTRD
ncbi:DUF7139 domain-containing protein [Halomarina ordinaria]|uniref:Ribonuclease BN n=1 Tax=Halomarina ordinaria TaxID=3033939 RepID=A0ABD5U850_9EURY|nr:hypothetical protein [Halomarina sp. PSRA2]